MARFSDIQEVIDKILRPTFFFCKGIFFRRYNDVGKEGTGPKWLVFIFSPYLVVNFLPLNGIPISPWKWLVHRNFTGVLLSTHSRRLAISLWLLLCRHQNCLFGGTCAVSKIYPNRVDILAPTFGIKSVLYPQDQHLFSSFARFTKSLKWSNWLFSYFRLHRL